MTRSDLLSRWRRGALCPVAAALLVALPAVAAAAASAVPPPPGLWVQPVDGAEVQVVRGFEPPAQRWLAGHRGADLAASTGSTVRAAGTGVVTYAGSVAGRGVVVVSHGDLRTTYEPVTAVVSAGRHVEAGQPIGRLAAAGSHCAPQSCLHWGLLRADTYLDPFGLLGGRTVRLLPLGPDAVPTRQAADVHLERPESWSTPGSGETSTVGPVLAAAAAAGLR